MILGAKDLLLLKGRVKKKVQLLILKSEMRTFKLILFS